MNLFGPSWFRVCEEKDAYVNGCQWRFYKNDADPWPSAQHAHCYEFNLKVDLFTGHVYHAGNGDHQRTMRSKELEELKAKLNWVDPRPKKAGE